MKAIDIVQILLYVGILIVGIAPLGTFMAKVFEGQRNFLSSILGWLERLTYRAAGVDPNEEMTWKDYTIALLIFNFFGIVVVFLLQMFQSKRPLDPASLPPITWHSAVNTAVSFVTKTNWQGYGGENTMSYLSNDWPGRTKLFKCGNWDRGVSGAHSGHRSQIAKNFR